MTKEQPEEAKERKSRVKIHVGICATVALTINQKQPNKRRHKNLSSIAAIKCTVPNVPSELPRTSTLQLRPWILSHIFLHVALPKWYDPPLSLM